MNDAKTLSIVITGGHTGIGLELTRRLFAENHRLGLIVRSKARIDAVPGEIRDSDRVTFWEADLANQSEVTQVAKTITEQWSQVDVLFNNAGVLLGELRKSPQGNEMHLEVNALAPYLLTTQLREALLAAERPLVANTATAAMNKRTLDLSELIEPRKFRRLVGAYVQSKLALTLLMNDLASQPEWSKVQIRTVDPGPNNTGMTGGNNKGGMPKLLLPIAKLLFPSPTKGADKLYQAAFASQHRNSSGVYLTGNRSKPVQHKLTPSEKEALLGGIKSAQPA